MGKQYNKLIKRQRRRKYLKRKKERELSGLRLSQAKNKKSAPAATKDSGSPEKKAVKKEVPAKKEAAKKKVPAKKKAAAKKKTATKKKAATKKAPAKKKATAKKKSADK